MAPNPVPIGIVLLYGLILLRFLRGARPARAKRWRRRLWLIALGAGPVLAATFCAVPVFVFDAGPWAWADFQEALPDVLGIGLGAGVIVAIAVWFTDG